MTTSTPCGTVFIEGKVPTSETYFEYVCENYDNITVFTHVEIGW